MLDAAASPPPPEAHAGTALPAELRTWMNLLAAAGAVEQQLRARVKHCLGISHDEFLVLCLLADHPAGLHMTQVAKLLGRPKTRLTYQIAMLHSAGLVTRAAGAHGDKRCIEVALTEKARNLLKESAGPLAEAIAQAVAAALGTAQPELLRRALDPAQDGTTVPRGCSAEPTES